MEIVWVVASVLSTFREIPATTSARQQGFELLQVIFVAGKKHRTHLYLISFHSTPTTIFLQESSSLALPVALSWFVDL